MNRLMVFAGAGISAESGLKTFRDDGGIWTQHNLNEVCNFSIFKLNKNNLEHRKKMFDFYNQRKQELNKVEPNVAHKTIAELQSKYGVDSVVVVTANIDNLFEKAGVKNVIHVHGDSDHMHCVACQHKWFAKEYNYEERCPKCNSRLTKPHVIFFGERAPEYARMNSLFNYKKRKIDDYVLVIGTSFEVISADRLIQKRTLNTILINKEVNEQDSWFNHKLYGNATEKILEVESIIK